MIVARQERARGRRTAQQLDATGGRLSPPSPASPGSLEVCKGGRGGGVGTAHTRTCSCGPRCRCGALPGAGVTNAAGAGWAAPRDVAPWPAPRRALNAAPPAARRRARAGAAPETTMRHARVVVTEYCSGFPLRIQRGPIAGPRWLSRIVRAPRLGIDSGNRDRTVGQSTMWLCDGRAQHETLPGVSAGRRSAPSLVKRSCQLASCVRLVSVLDGVAPVCSWEGGVCSRASSLTQARRGPSLLYQGEAFAGAHQRAGGTREAQTGEGPSHAQTRAAVCAHTCKCTRTNETSTARSHHRERHRDSSVGAPTSGFQSLNVHEVKLCLCVPPRAFERAFIHAS